MQLISRFRLLHGRLGREHSKPEVWRGGDDKVGEALRDAVINAGTGEGYCGGRGGFIFGRDADGQRGIVRQRVFGGDELEAGDALLLHDNRRGVHAFW